MATFTNRCRRAVPSLIDYLQEDTHDLADDTGKLNPKHPMVRRLKGESLKDMQTLITFLLERAHVPRGTPIETTHETPTDVPDPS